MSSLTTQQRYIFIIALALMFFISHAAFAQIGFGAGSGGDIVGPIIRWIIANLVIPLLSIGVIVVGVLLISGEHRMMGLITMIAGAVVISQYQTIVGLLPQPQ
jgi:hypothetical protein